MRAVKLSLYASYSCRPTQWILQAGILICPVCFPVPLCRLTSRVDIDGSGEVSGAEFAEWLSHETESLSR